MEKKMEALFEIGYRVLGFVFGFGLTMMIVSVLTSGTLDHFFIFGSL
jgi:hypothetical protein